MNLTMAVMLNLTHPCRPEEARTRQAVRPQQVGDDAPVVHVRKCRVEVCIVLRREVLNLAAEHILRTGGGGRAAGRAPVMRTYIRLQGRGNLEAIFQGSKR